MVNAAPSSHQGMAGAVRSSATVILQYKMDMIFLSGLWMMLE